MDSSHEAQIAHNMKFLERISTPDHDHPDWEITVMFYIILHLVDHYCIRNGLAEAKNHRMRRYIVKKNIRQIHSEYEALLDLSMQARYVRGHTMILNDLRSCQQLVQRSAGVFIA